MCLGRGRCVWCTLLMEVLVVEPQNHQVLRRAGFAEFGPQNSTVWFRREPEEPHGVIAKGASRQSNFV
jgi:hypothetical protein